MLKLVSLELTAKDMKSGGIYKTRYATWNNFGLKKEDKDTTSYQLLADTLNSIGIHEGTMFQYQQFCKEDEDYMKNMELLQYDMLYGEKYAYHGEDAYPASDLVMGIDEVRQYFINYGMDRGHQASEEFNVLAYRNRYPDLRIAFGNDYKLYYMHYINYGKAEGRNGREEEDKDPDKTPNVNADAIFDGVNYADVYDFDYYIEHYPDLKAAFGNNRIGALEHFVVYGMSEYPSRARR